MPAAIWDSLSLSESTLTTLPPLEARQAAVLRPTYPRQMTETEGRVNIFILLLEVGIWTIWKGQFLVVKYSKVIRGRRIVKQVTEAEIGWSIW